MIIRGGEGGGEVTTMRLQKGEICREGQTNLWMNPVQGDMISDQGECNKPN